MKLALAQINTTVGDLEGNARKVERDVGRAAAQGASVVLFPELTVCGYPPRDFAHLGEFVAACEATLESLAARLAGGPAAVVGTLQSRREGDGNRCYNSLAWLEGGRIQAIAHKSLLPNYDVFDEQRYFAPGTDRVSHGQTPRFGLSICEDLWNDKRFWQERRYALDPLDDFRRQQVAWLLNASASPYAQGKPQLRREMVASAARHHGYGIALCNLVGGNDSLVFDGNSLVVNAAGELIAAARALEEDLLVVDLDAAAPRRASAPGVEGFEVASAPEAASTRGEPPDAPASPEAEVYAALCLGLRDYVHKTGFQDVVLGLSGGVDSALTAAIAADALGPEHVLCVAMPSRFTASMSDEDAERLARNLGTGLEVIPIEPLLGAFEQALEGVFAGQPRNVAEENLQARIRGVLLMAISNKRGSMLLTTGNKSELSVGYCTIYGDMAGGLAVIGDVEKTLVYRLCEWRNREREVIPRRILERPPSAELRADQTDQDTLPPYDTLDAILRELVERHAGGADLRRLGHPPELISRVRGLVVRAEYKRRQAAPTLKVSARAFGEGWRFPIAQRYRPPEVDDPAPA